MLICYISVNLLYISVRTALVAGDTFVLESLPNTKTKNQPPKLNVMKTQANTNPTLPSPVKFSIYVIVVALVCFFNWNALKASDYPKEESQSLEARLEAALIPVAENEIILEDWMLHIADDLALESEIVLEDWMLIVPDPAPAIEDWMVNTETWVQIEFMATK